METQIAFIGVGRVGQALASRLARLGHKVCIAARDPGSDSVRQAQADEPMFLARPIQEAVAAAQVIFLATPFDAAGAVLRNAGDLTGKVLVDCTNPTGPGLKHGLEGEISGGEQVQALVPEAKVVKAFNIYGYENFGDSAYPGYDGLKPAMLIAGNDASAKAMVGDLCTQLGWDPIDTGDITMSLHLEHLALLWIKMARVQGRGAGFVWAMLKR